MLEQLTQIFNFSKALQENVQGIELGKYHHAY